METTQRRTGSTAIAGGAALGMAGTAAVLLGAADAIWVGIPTSDGPGLSLLYITGWALLSWAGIVGLIVAVLVVRSVVSRRRPALLEVVLIIATAAVIVGVLLVRPFAGSSEGGAEVESVAPVSSLQRGAGR